MLLKIGCIVFGLLISVISPTRPPPVFCDDRFGRFTSLGGNLNLLNVEFPIMSGVPPGENLISKVDLSIPKVMHPCYSLNNANNYKNQMFGIFDYGDFAKSVCMRQCLHFVDAFRLECGDRRPSPDWQAGNDNTPRRKINCSDWAIPLTDKGKKDGIALTFTYGTFANGEDLAPPYTLDDHSMAYMDTMFIKGFHLKPIVNPSMKHTAMTEMESILEQFIQRHPEIIHIGFGNQNTFFGDASHNEPKYFAPRFVPSANFWTQLGKVPSLNSLALSLIEITGKEEIPPTMTQNLKAIGFYNVTMAAIPNWVQTDQLQFLEFSATLTDSTDMTVMDNLPELEHFLLTESMLTNIKSPFLAKSGKLLSLTLQCNAISSISAGAFDHLTEIKFLNLAGNRLVTLPDNLLINLHSLLALDLKTVDNSTNTLSSYNEGIMPCQLEIKPALTTPPVLNAMPVVPNPGMVMTLDIRGQTNFLKLDRRMLMDFTEVEDLNLGNLGLTSLHHLALETLCNLDGLNLYDNPLNEDDWLPEDIFVNINLQYLRLGKVSPDFKITNTLIGFMRTASQIMYSVPRSLEALETFRNKMGCDYETIYKATMQGYKIKNASCVSIVDKALEKIRSMEMEKMDTKCGENHNWWTPF